MFSLAPARQAPAHRVFRTLGTLRGETGFPRADVENDFLRARRRQVADRIAHSLRGQRASSSLVSLDEVVGALGRRGEQRLGLQTIRLDTIVGTLDARRDFDHRFRPTSNRVRPRWERLALAQRRGEPIPPIQVYRVGGLHFVEDGHHRVSVAMATRQEVIDAYVTEVLTHRPGPEPSNPPPGHAKTSATRRGTLPRIAAALHTDLRSCHAPRSREASCSRAP
jgi:hypothetical protein